MAHIKISILIALKATTPCNSQCPSVALIHTILSENCDLNNIQILRLFFFSSNYYDFILVILNLVMPS